MLDLKRAVELRRRHEVILHGVAVADYFRLLQAFDAPDQRVLHVCRQAGGDAVRINKLTVAPFRFEKYVVGCPLREAVDLILNRRAVSGTTAGDLPIKKGRTVPVCCDYCVRNFVCVRNPARSLQAVNLRRAQRKRLNRRVPRLFLENGVVDASALQSRRSACFHPSELDA